MHIHKSRLKIFLNTSGKNKLKSINKRTVISIFTHKYNVFGANTKICFKILLIPL